MSFGHLALRGVLLVVLLAFLGPLAYRAGWHESAGRKGDTRFYRAAAARYWAGENLYYQDGFMNPEGWRPTTAYTYLPPWALVSSWTLLFPYRAVRVLWLALMVLCAWALWRTTAALLRELEPDPGAEDLLLASYARATDVLGLSAAALLVGRFVINDLAHGQVNLLLAWLVALSLLACLRGREGWAALALAAAL